MGPSPPINPSFTARKNAVLASLSTPDDTYTDLSPKGTVDEAIKPLIDRINGLEGVVTTSSCAGRISVFLEGSKHQKGHGENTATSANGCEDAGGQAAVPGGKGMGGRWLFVSHEPVHFSALGGCLASQLGVSPTGQVYDRHDTVDAAEMRLARFQFEPMILHIMTASLHHAQPILTAAINAGFRESGVQSLKNLDDTNAFPMVAIRTAGLALESIIGRVSEHAENEGPDDDRCPQEAGVDCLVSEGYLAMLVKLANERFKTNTERIRRFETDLFRREAGSEATSQWEESKARHERKRAEGLKQQEEVGNSRMKETKFNYT